MTTKNINGKSYKFYKASRSKARAVEIRNGLVKDGYDAKVRKGVPLSVDVVGTAYSVWMR